jgi:ubiquinone/menaquinone biosynthesis C-methylase UbiE
MESKEPNGYRSFREMEWLGWQRRAPHYHDRLGQLTAQAIVHILDAVCAGPGMRLLDICCGPGHACAQAAPRGLTTVGVDFAPAMVNEALTLFPNLDFRVGDAEALAFPDESFDAAVCPFGLLHLAHPERGLSEAYRVIKLGGAYAFTVWCTSEKAQLFGLFMDAVAAQSDAMNALPAGPSFFHFSDPATGADALARTGFRDVTVRELPLVYEGPSIDEVLDWVREEHRAHVSPLSSAACRGERAHQVGDRIESNRVFDRREAAHPLLGHSVLWPQACPCLRRDRARSLAAHASAGGCRVKFPRRGCAVGFRRHRDLPAEQPAWHSNWRELGNFNRRILHVRLGS